MFVSLILQNFLKAFFTFFNPYLLIPVAIILILVFIQNKQYKKSHYFQITHIHFFSLWFDKGRYGEYLVYKYLKDFEKKGAKFLFNVYIPKNKEQTSEIDVLMICRKGIMVFESKNYSGWIFGKEFQRNWCQVLPVARNSSRKEYFYNPVIQNRSHVKNLKNCIGDTFPIWSIIVFSERCTLKKIEINSNDVSVIKRNDVNSTISFIYNQNSEDLLSESDITNIYNQLYPYTQVDDKVKAEHILNISNNSGRAL